MDRHATWRLAPFCCGAWPDAVQPTISAAAWRRTCSRVLQRDAFLQHTHCRRVVCSGIERPVRRRGND
jgi:myo-inositol catabolism protein IolC